ncbi:MAG: efflux RND transporter periplasmic adaptor subunit, partial [Deltaproteobacteria bacterium]|nr:efflux RND transporter periplasmic adaptor subunit [Deltaproteobacteria bacterium]
VELGQRVKKGQVLARIDTRTLRAQQTQAKANYELAKTTHGRLENLGADLVSRQKLDETKSALTGAQAQLAIASDSVAKSVLRSTISGVVSTKFVDKAEYVAPGTPMFRIVDHRTIVIEAQLPETQVAMVSTGAKVAVTVNALDEDFEGVVDTILPTADPVSKTFTVRIKVDNSDFRILVGMSATVKIAARVHEDVVALPQDIVIEGKDARSVFIAKNGVAKKRDVRLGAVEGDRVVILEGLESGEEVIVLGHRDLTDGQPIQIVR